MISKRTKDALAAAKRRGRKLGGLRRKILRIESDGRKTYGEPVLLSATARKNGNAAVARAAAARADDVAPVIAELQASGAESLRAIAAGLNSRGIPTARGAGSWSAVQVARVLERSANQNSRGSPHFHR